MSNLYLVDGMSLVFRAYHALFASKLTNDKGEPTSALFGFVNLLSSILEKEKPENILIVFDTEQKTFRHLMYPAYKANRAEFPEELAPQLVKIKKFISLIGLEQMESPGYEADDVIGTLAKRASEQNWKAFCITSDKDYYQLVDDNICLLKPGKRAEQFEKICYEEVKEKFGVLPEQVIDVLALIGDTSDNVPGVKGIGEKTAIPLIQNYHSLEGLYEHIEEIDKLSVKSKLIADKANAFFAKKLVTIDTNVPIDRDITEFCIKAPSYKELDEFFSEQGFNQIRERWRKKAPQDALLDFQEVLPQIKTINDHKLRYLLVTDETLDETIEYLMQFDTLSFDLETDSLDTNTCEIVGVALSVKEDEAFYIPVAHENDNFIEESVDSLFAVNIPKEESQAKAINYRRVIDAIKPLLENPKIGKCGQNIKFDSYIVNRMGINPSPIVFDTMVADYLINPDEKHNLDALSERWLNYKPIPISKLIGEKKSTQITMREVDIDVACKYACEDADLALKLKNVLSKELDKAGMTNLAYKMEFPLIEVLTQMELTGVKIDLELLKEISKKLTIEIDIFRKQIWDLAGEEFNIDSPKQLGAILFDKLQIAVGRKTKTGFSTDAQVLSELALEYPIADLILNYRQLVKLKSTYVDALPQLADKKANKLHTTYNQTVASTGRLSSTDPNLQNIPIRTEIGQQIRKAFIPSSADNIIISADYSQIELRVMAHICGDENLINAFINKQDIHSATASVLFGVDLGDVDSNMRRTAKTVNFGILYGLGSFGLSQRLRIPRKEASDIIYNYFQKYPSIKNYMNNTIEDTRKKGYCETLCGRRRYFPDINHKNANLRAAAERAAINMPIQGTASDMIKIAMLRVSRLLEEEKFQTRMILQVHDELVFDGPGTEYEEIKPKIENEMINALPLGNVPILVEIGKGNNWLESH